MHTLAQWRIAARRPVVESHRAQLSRDFLDLLGLLDALVRARTVLLDLRDELLVMSHIFMTVAARREAAQAKDAFR